MIRFPAPLKANATIAVTAPSSGVLPAYHPRLDLVYEHLKQEGFRIIEGHCLRSDHKHVSAPKEQRAQELLRFWNDPGVDPIFPPWGGELAIDLLPLLDFEAMKASPTWIQGFSDTKYGEVLEELFGDLPIPVVYDCDIGHRVPQMTLVNGAIAEVHWGRGSGWIDQTLA